MGISHTHRAQLAPALVLMGLGVLVVVAVMALTAGPAAAYSGYVHGGTACSSCHSGAAVTNTNCVTCHTSYAVPTSGTTCWTCHTPGQDVQPIKTGAPTTCTDVCHLANGTDHQHNPHPSRGTCTTCHNVTTNATTANGSPHHTVKQTPPPAAVVAKTTITGAKVTPTSVKVKKSVKVSGIAGPVASLAGAKVTFKVERKVGAKWTKMKTGSAVTSAKGAFKWSYKTAKKGAHRVTMSIAKSATHTTKSVVKTFKVK